jgi:hypothetical protein
MDAALTPPDSIDNARPGSAGNYRVENFQTVVDW